MKKVTIEAGSKKNRKRSMRKSKTLCRKRWIRKRRMRSISEEKKKENEEERKEERKEEEEKKEEQGGGDGEREEGALYNTHKKKTP